ncbi:hypothetical protein PPERSA_00695 [Pseudocohnilembus persalinus]|uniref:tRNAHis guanylyltransferase catalytic domain-containing protein n=1 Tax=Pseudocohnilembus persalinus TaxID=266149 RepID=A0A0V0QSV2_PSEPJ|nr:hypothetical protein PPERSA_00695 [Pseudocohnilembus persalinus]|eukprot:KRX05394.1 hypothetical protein PPERSA_00695 [Pseudocohnilembus persalinus]
MQTQSPPQKSEQTDPEKSPKNPPKTHQAIGDRMKSYEKSSRTHLDPSLPVIIRIDGHSFSKFTKGLKKPFENWFHELMVETTANLMQEFQVNFGYTQSDEITLIYTPSFDKQNRLNDYPFKNQQKLKNANCFFDARIFNVPSLPEAFSNVYWRSCYDCVKNSVSMAAYCHFSEKKISGFSTAQRIEALKKEKNIDWNTDFSNHFKYGTFIKKRAISIDMPEKYKNFKNNDQKQNVQRREFIAFSVNLSQKKFDENVSEFLFSKILNEKFLANDSPFEITEMYTVDLN